MILRVREPRTAAYQPLNTPEPHCASTVWGINRIIPHENRGELSKKIMHLKTFENTMKTSAPGTTPM